MADRAVAHAQGPRHFIECLRERRPPSLGLAEGRQALALILAAYRAAATGCRERIDQGGPP